MLTRKEIIQQHNRNIDAISCQILTYRCFGDAKIAKPKELKGLKYVKELAFKGKKVKVFRTVGGSIV